MPDPASVETIRAAVDTIQPSVDGKPGAVELGVERHVVELVEGALPGTTDLIAALLNAYAEAVRPGVGFAGLTPEERTAVMRTMATDESQEIREAVDTLQVFTYGGTYSEWTSFDPKTRSLERPAMWDDVGYNGPNGGVPDYRVDI